MKALVIATNTDQFFLSHRLLLAEAAKQNGYRVICAAPPGLHVQKIIDLGFEFYPLALSRKGVNPLIEVLAIWRCVRLFKALQPTVVHAFTLKPVTYLGLAHRFFPRTRFIATMTGLGSSFLDNSLRGRLLRKVIGGLLRAAFRPRSGIKVIFQNQDDRQLFVNRHWTTQSQSTVIKGTGVDLDLYRPAPKNPKSEIVFVYVGRLLKDKGLEELMAAFERLFAAEKNCRLLLLGETDLGNPSSITEERKNQIEALPFIKAIRRSPSVAKELGEADVAVLPSYREGVPQAMMEACAAGLPLVATDVPGCREVVDPEKNGLLVPAKNVEQLFEAMLQLARNSSLREEMGKASRRKAEMEFDFRDLTNRNLKLYEE